MQVTRFESRLFLVTFLSLPLLLLPALFTSRSYLFLFWNVYLGMLPLFFAFFAQRFQGFSRFGLMAVWLLFFPNAIYIWTDIIHPLRIIRYSCPVGDVITCDQELIRTLTYPSFDLGRVGFWAAVVGTIVAIGLGLAYAKASWDRIKELLPKLWFTFSIFIVSLLTAFAVTLGRFERTNSWYVVSNPLRVVEDIFDTCRKLFSDWLYAVTFIISFFITLFIVSRTHNKSPHL